MLGTLIVLLVTGGTVGAGFWLRRDKHLREPCPSCGARGLLGDRVAFELWCEACGQEYRRIATRLYTREDWERDDPNRIPRARVVTTEPPES